MKRIWNSNLFFAILLTGGFFVGFLLLCRPILNSDDDFYLLYTLAGGYGAKPSHILHYFQGWYPFVFWPVSRLFARWPGVNWYGLFLLALQVVACSHLAHTLLSMFQRSYAILLFGFFFLFFESMLLLSLNNSNTSLLLGIVGCSALLSQIAGEQQKKTALFRPFIFPMLLLIVSGLLRAHPLALCLFLTAMARVTLLPVAGWKKLFKWLAVVVGIVAAFYAVHFWYYAAQIPDYSKEEGFRDAIFRTSNLPLDHATKDTGIAAVKSSFIRSLFLYDTSFVNTNDIEIYLHSRNRPGIRSIFRRWDHLYWLFINHRVYLLLLLCSVLLFVAVRDYKSLRQWLLLFAAAVLLLSFFFLFLKITAWILFAVLSFLYFAVLLLLKEAGVKSSPAFFAVFALFLFNAVWMGIRIRATNRENEATIAQTHAILGELRAHPDKLFVNTTYFNDRGYTLRDTPAEYPLSNFLNIGNILTNSAGPTFRRFGVDNIMQRLPERENLFVSGKHLPQLQEYYRRVHGLNVYLQPVSSFRHLEVYRIKVKMN